MKCSILSCLVNLFDFNQKTQLINFLDDCRIIILIKNIVKSSKDNLISKY